MEVKSGRLTDLLNYVRFFLLDQFQVRIKRARLSILKVTTGIVLFSVVIDLGIVKSNLYTFISL